MTCLTIKTDVYEAFVDPEESFWEGLFYAQITLNLLLYLQLFHEWGACTQFPAKIILLGLKYFLKLTVDLP